MTNSHSSAASAIAANTFVRSAVAAGFPLFSSQMFNNMGIQWAATLLGCLATILIPIPVYFWFCGKSLRKRSKFAPVFEPQPQPPDNNVDDNQAPEQEQEQAAS